MKRVGSSADEWKFLFECEEGCHTSISGKERFLKFLGIIPKLRSPSTVLDVGGNLGTARWLQHAFPGAKVTILNNSDKQLAGYPDLIKADAQNFDTPEKCDLVFAGEVIEHVYNPDGLVASCALALKPSGYLVLTTPNLACIFNRIFLALGWSPANYFASLRYLVGNPLGPKTGGKFGIVADHKSVFTWRGLEELLGIYGLKVLHSNGYTYAQYERSRTVGELYYELPHVRARFFLTGLLPKRLREGMIFVCQRRDDFDVAHAASGRLTQEIWEIGG
jgi:SAM-dependent methyltransferase